MLFKIKSSLFYKFHCCKNEMSGKRITNVFFGWGRIPKYPKTQLAIVAKRVELDSRDSITKDYQIRSNQLEKLENYEIRVACYNNREL